MVWVLFIRGAMTKEEIDKFIDELPDLQKNQHYIFNYAGSKYLFEYLLPTGELLVASDGLCMATDAVEAKSRLKHYMEKPGYGPCMGIGYYHRLVKG